MIALVDCNNFYASCETVFNPALKGRPIVVLSNNDGCAIARSQEAKALGITMGMPAHLLKQLPGAEQVTVFSSNYTLYGDMSERVTSILADFSPSIELYSIDEAFLEIPGEDPQANHRLLAELRQRVSRYTGIPLTIGMAATKTLAKMANRYAKKKNKENGIYCLDSQQSIDEVLRLTPVRDIWGIGKQQESFLMKNGISTAWAFSRANEAWVRKNFSVTGVRMLQELKGIPCIKWEDQPAAKKEICTSRSFGQVLSDKEDIKEAIANHAGNVSLKLRKQQSVARLVKVFIQTNPFRTGDMQYFRSVQLELPVATNSANELISYALKGFEMIYSSNYKYLKTGITASAIVPAPGVQRGLFDNRNRASDNALMKSMDAANKLFGKEMVRIASQGYQKKWKLKACHLSPRYTTNYDELLTIKI